jgi:transposase
MTKRKTFSREFKIEAIRLMESGQKKSSDLARELGVPRNRLYKWREQLQRDGKVIFPRNRGHVAKQLWSSLQTRPANDSRAWSDDVAGYRTLRSIRKYPGVLPRA